MNYRSVIYLLTGLMILILSSCTSIIPAQTTSESSVIKSPLGTPTTQVTPDNQNSPNTSTTPAAKPPRMYGKLVFSHDTDGSGSYQIGILDLAAKDEKMITTSPNPGDAEPRWAPDGKSIYFTSGRNTSEGYVIYKMNRDGSNQIPVTTVADRNTINSQVSISPDGKQIVFHSNRDGNLEIYLAQADGSSPRNLTNSASNEVYAAWSPDGKHLIFASDRIRNEYQIFTMDTNGENVRTLTDITGVFSYAAKYSPDGKRIAFLTRASSVGNPQIAIANADGTARRNITNGFDEFSNFTWMGNGALIYTTRVSSAQPWSIAMMELETGISVPVLSGAKHYSDPDWVEN